MIRHAAIAIGILVLAACAPPPWHRAPDYEPLDKVGVGDTPEKAEQALGKPASRTNGWWWNPGIGYSTDYQVWRYKGVGRVIFDRYSKKVVATEADAHETGWERDERL